jgi:hypothetical protein
MGKVDPRTTHGLEQLVAAAEESTDPEIREAIAEDIGSIVTNQIILPPTGE